MKYFSLCSGIEAASCAWHHMGWECVGVADIEPFPSAVIAHHYPTVKNYGDMTQWRTWDIDWSSVDVLVGGTPCQSFSVAGKRQSLSDERGNLSLTYTEILDEIDAARKQAGRNPAIALWENVPGVLSTKDNAFGCFVSRLAGERETITPAARKWPRAGLVVGTRRRVSWCILDAQYFGVAQRRRRVFVVARDCQSVGGAGAVCPSEVLALGTCLRGDTPTRTATGEGAAGSTKDRASTWWSGGQCAATLTTRSAGCNSRRPDMQNFSAVLVYRKSRRAQSSTDCETWVDDGIANTLNQFDTGERDTHAVVWPAIIAPTPAARSGSGTPGTTDQELFSQNAAGLVPVVAPVIAVQGNLIGRVDAVDLFNQTINSNTHCPLRTAGGHGAPAAIERTGAAAGTVRRLTPRECERLQGFPDDWTLIPWRGKSAVDCPDGPRYKAIGNSMAVPVMRWLGERINQTGSKESS